MSKGKKDKLKVVAFGNVNSDGSILNATPGIKIETRGVYTENMYRVVLPKGLVNNDNYIIQLTQELVDDSDQDQFFTSIGYLFRKSYSFQVGIIRGNAGQYVKGNWSFVIYDLK